MHRHNTYAHRLSVAPPRGERGLKLSSIVTSLRAISRRSPSWGAWIEIDDSNLTRYGENVAPPRGERGLKSLSLGGRALPARVAPPRGERGLK